MAAGGVGLAAAQLATSRGIGIIATAGSSSKRSMLRSSSCQAVINSRNTSFATDAAQLSCNISSALSSLTSPGMVAASLATLQIGGQFVEIGKREIWSAARVAQERPDVLYQFVAVDFLPKPVIQASLLGISKSLSQGCLQPLPQILHPASDAQSAFRQMSQARHIGKIVIQTAQQAQQASSGHSMTLITGGLGTLGSLVAGWMSSQLTGSLCLLGRSGHFPSSSPAIVKLVQSESSSEVVIAKTDTSSQDETHSLLRELSAGQKSARQLQGLVHSGGALADATLTKQSLQVKQSLTLTACTQQAFVAFETVSLMLCMLAFTLVGKRSISAMLLPDCSGLTVSMKVNVPRARSWPAQESADYAQTIVTFCLHTGLCC